MMWRKSLTIGILFFVIYNIPFFMPEILAAKGKSITENLKPGEGIFEGKINLPVITMEDGKQCFAPTPFPMQASGTLIWKGPDRKINKIEVKDAGTCAVPGVSGMDGLKPCFSIGNDKYLILLDANPKSSSYKGRVLEMK